MFEISGVYAPKIHTNGAILRHQSMFKTQLHTEEGVMRWLDEQKPFLELKIMNVVAREDVTEYFTGEK